MPRTTAVIEIAGTPTEKESREAILRCQILSKGCATKPTRPKGCKSWGDLAPQQDPTD
jgi:hypothetical protein